MPVITTSSIGTGNRLTPLANSITIIGANARVESTDTFAIASDVNNVYVRVTSGASAIGNFGGVYLGSSTASGESLIVDAGGLVSSLTYYGAYVGGDNFTVRNAGQISGPTYGLIFELHGQAMHGTIDNSGLIAGEYAIMYEQANDDGHLTVRNSGKILGVSAALLSAASVAIDAVNTGEIFGLMAFGDEADSLNNAKGTIQGQIYLGGGEDTLSPGLGIETANGGIGYDWLDFSSQGAVEVYLDGSFVNQGAAAGDTYGFFENIIGSLTGSDLLQGNFDTNVLFGQGGNDSLFGGNNADTLWGGAGNDSLDGESGVDRMEGGTGDDIYVIDSASDVILELAGEGTDLVMAAVSATLAAQVENGTVIAPLGTSLTGNTLSNRLVGGMSGDTLIGGDGNDTLLGSTGGDSLDGGNGNDSLDGGTGADILRGGAGNDVFRVNEASDVVIEGAGGGTDLVQTEISLVLGAELEQGFIVATTGRGLTGNGLANVLTGNIGNDSLVGAAGADSLLGGSGNDTLSGGSGSDVLTGGLGADRFLFLSKTDGPDRITDFKVGDKIGITVAGFGGGLTAGALAASQLQVRADNLAQDANDRFIFRTTDHSLWFDQNGNAAGGLSHIGWINPVTTVSASDFILL